MTRRQLLFALCAVPSVSFAAPWPIRIDAVVPQAPPQARRYLVDAVPVVTESEAAAIFGLAGPWSDVRDPGAPDAVRYVRDLEDHGYLYELGGLVFHDTNVLGAEAKMVALTNTQIWSAAENLLYNGLDIQDVGPTHLARRAIGKGNVTLSRPDGSTVGPILVSQLAVFGVTVAGVRTFGAGGEATVLFGKNAKVGAVDAPVRNLIDAGLQPVVPFGAALASFGDRADLTNRFNMVKAGLDVMDELVVESVALGYYLPGSTTPTDTVELAWELKGTMVGTDFQGNPATASLEWYEPAFPDGEIPSLCVSAWDPFYDCAAQVPPNAVKPTP